jgi:hypothetical protein
MALLDNPRRVHVETPAGVWLGNFLGDMRIWLDRHEIALMLFERGKSAGPWGAFDLSFQSEGEAMLFDRRFG